MKMVIGIILGAAGLVAIALLAGPGGLEAGERGYKKEHYAEHAWRGKRKRGAPDNPLYREECGACHTAYPPGLLPAAAWEGIMAGLSAHFGEAADLPEETTAALTRYLVGNAAGDGKGGRTPLRITETRYFMKEHDEIPPRLVTGNPEVSSWANCGSCHPRAEAGSFDEDTVRIPGYGRWDD